MAGEAPTEKQLKFVKRLLSTVGDGSMDVVVEVLGAYSPPETWNKYECSQVIEKLKALGDSKSGHVERSTKAPEDWYNVEPPDDTG